MYRFVFLLFVIGCAPTKQVQRGHLADPIMLPNSDFLEGKIEQHTFPYREGTTEVGVQSGGCGC